MNNLNAKEKIIDFTINLIKKYQGNLEKVTIREIASLGNWNVGLINFHFKNKENLIKICVNKIIEGVVFNYSPDMSNDDNKTDKENASFKAEKINENSSNLVIYFSRTGHSKKIAYQVALEEKAKIYELKTSEKIDGDLGFWWCGRFAMHKWGMDLEKIDIDLSNYSKIIIVSPIWVFRIYSPIRKFLIENEKVLKIKMLKLS